MKGKEKKDREREAKGEWNLGKVCIIRFRGIDAPGNRGNGDKLLR